MADCKTTLPNASENLYLTDGGLETTLVFLEGYELPCFAAFVLLHDEKGYHILKNYYRRYLAIAKDLKADFILESPTWRANPDWLQKTGYPASALSEVNEKAIQLLVELKKKFEGDISNIILSGCVGPRGDGYKPENIMTAEEAQNYHLAQIHVFSQTTVNMVSAITMNVQVLLQVGDLKNVPPELLPGLFRILSLELLPGFIRRAEPLLIAC